MSEQLTTFTTFQKDLLKKVNTKEDFNKLVATGMFWEWMPMCDGTWADWLFWRVDATLAEFDK